MPSDQAKTKKELIAELNALRQHNAELEDKIQILMSREKALQDRYDASEQALSQLRVIFNAMPAMVKAVDKRCNMLAISGQLMKAYDIPKDESVAGLKCHEVLRGKSAACPECTAVRVFKSGNQEIRLSNPEEEKRTRRAWKIYAAPIRNHSGEISGAVEVITDVTDLRMMEKSVKAAKNRAEMANRAKSEFLSNMSHEFRTPLNAILGYTQILRHDKTLNDKHARAIDTIHRSGEHLLTMINDILDISKIEAGKMGPEPEDFRLTEFLRRIADIARFRAHQEDISFHYKANPNLPRDVRGDQRCLRQILLNLLGNAIKFTQNGEVVLTVSCQPSAPRDNGQQRMKNGQRTHTRIRFQIKDTGIGISNKKLEKIFLPFHQVGDWRIKSEGTGLGLAICRKLLRKMNSDLFVESIEGQGSTFWFDLDLPEISGRNESVNPDGQKHIINFKGGTRKILIVDDTEKNRTLLKDVLFPIGFEVMEAVNGHDALNKAAGFHPDLILMDLAMPVMDGFEAASEIRKTSALADVIMIAVTEKVDDETKKWCLAAGCDDHIVKPVDVDRLMRVLKQHLKLEWVYENDDQQDKKMAEHIPVVPPPKKEIEALFNLAMKGDIFGIRKRAKALSMSAPELAAFGETLCQLSKEFLIEEIQHFIGQYR